MKLFALAMMAAACTVAANAQTPYGNLDNQDDAYLKARQVKETDYVIKLATTPVASTIAKAPAEEGLTAMFDQPEGEKILMRRTGTDYLPMWGSPSPADYTDKGTYVVKGTDGNYYFKNFVTNMCNGGAWVKGTVEGDIVSVATGQICTQLWWDNSNGRELFTYYLYALNFTTHTEVDPYYGTEYEVREYFPVMDVESIQFRIQEDGSLTTLDSEMLYGGVEMVNGEWSWPGYGDKNCCFYPSDEAIETAPADAEFKPMLMKYSVYSQDSYRFVEAAYHDYLLYIRGLAEILPEGIVVGIENTDSGSFKFLSGEFMGVEEKYSTMVFLKGAQSVVNVDEWGWTTISFEPCDMVELTYDAEKDQYEMPENAMLVNVGPNEILHHEAYDRPTMKWWNEVAATPATPVWTQFMPYTVFDWGAWGYAGFDIYTLDVDGNYILPDELYYICYLDDAVFEIYDEATRTIYDEIPYNFSNNDVVGGGYNSHYIYFYVDGFERFGVQSVYYGGGERKCSPVVYYGEEPEDPVDPVAISTANREISSTSITDASGNVRSHLGQGLNIVTVRYTDGTVKTAKMMIK